MEQENFIRVSKTCAVCGLRLFDKMSPLSGTIEIKCPRCGKIAKINLAFRLAAARPTSTAFIA